MGRIQPNERKRLEEQLIKKIWNDPAFINEISQNPKAVLEGKFSVSIENDAKIFFHKEKVNEIHIVIPKY